MAIISPVSLFSTVPVLDVRTSTSFRRNAAVGVSGARAVQETRAVNDSSWIFSIIVKFLELVNISGLIGWNILDLPPMIWQKRTQQG